MTEPEIVQIARKARDWQQSRNLSDAELCRLYAGLGSTKTFKRILDGDLAELDIDERWLPEYRCVWGLMELADQSSAEDEVDYDDLTNVTRARLAVQRAMQERGNNRMVIIEGAPGTGKTAAARCLAGRYGRKLVLAEADELWHNSPAVMLGGLLRSLRVTDIPVNPEDRKLKLLECVRATPCCFIIDDAHHFGPRNLNLCKTLVNQTTCQIILCGVDTLFRRLEKTAYEEARQILNRLGERVKFESPRASDVEKFSARRGVKWVDAKTAAHCCKALGDRAALLNNWNFINGVCRKLKAADEPITEETANRVAQSVAAMFN
jgi:hypothetical protein